MAEKTELKTVVSAEVAPFVQGMKRAERSSSRFSQAVRSSSRSASSTSGVLRSAAVPALAATAAAAYGAVKAMQSLTGSIQKAVSLAADAESMQVSFEVMLGSTKRAKQLLSDINSFAASTPFQTKELQAASRSLVAFGVEVDDIMPTMRRLGDVSSGVGMSIEELAEIYGKARTAGTLFAEDINQLTGRGIPVIAEFAKQFGVAESEVKKLGSEGKITFANLEQAMVDLTSENGQFGGMMARQSQTFNGVLSTMRDNVDMIFKDVGEVLIDEFNLGELATDFTDFVKTNRESIRQFVSDFAHFFKQNLANVVDFSLLATGKVIEFFVNIEKVIVRILNAVAHLGRSMRNMARNLQAFNAGLGNKAGEATFAGIARGLDTTSSNLKGVVNQLAAGTKIAEGRANAFIKMGQSGSVGDMIRNLGGGSGLDAIEKDATPDAKVVDTRSQLANSFDAFMSFGRAIAKGIKFEQPKQSGISMQGGNTAVLAGTSAAVSLENERARAQVDIGKSQLEELQQMRAGIEMLVSNISGGKMKVEDSLAGLF